METDKFLNYDRAYERLVDEYNKHKVLVIGFDFDATVRDYHKEGYTYEKCINLLKRLKSHGMRLICWTAYHDHDYVSTFLKEKGIEVEGINTDGVDLGYNSRKPFFNALLDDRAGLYQVYNNLSKLCDLLDLKERDPNQCVLHMNLEAYKQYLSDSNNSKIFEPIFVKTDGNEELFDRIVSELRNNLLLLNFTNVIVVKIANSTELLDLYQNVNKSFNSGILVISEDMSFTDLLLNKFFSVLVYDETARNTELAKLQKINKDFDYYTNFNTLFSEVIKILEIYRM